VWGVMLLRVLSGVSDLFDCAVLGKSSVVKAVLEESVRHGDGRR
jgi:hypothetical protein